VVHETAAVVADCRLDVCRERAEIRDERFSGFSLEIGLAFDGAVELVGVSLMMLVVVDFHRFRIDVRFEGVERIS
jgi:hypothetical protein